MRYAIAFSFESVPSFNKILYKDNLIEFWNDNTLLYVISRENLTYFNKEIKIGLEFVDGINEKDAFDTFRRKFTFNILNAVIKEISCDEIIR